MTVFEIIGIILIIAGLILVEIEMILPGFGFPGISGIICLVLGIIGVSDSVSDGIVLTIVLIVVLGIMLAGTMTLLKSNRLKSPIVLREDVKGETGFLGAEDLEYLIGKTGVAMTDLRPAGKGNFDGINLDIMSDGQYISKGAQVEIIKVKDNKLVVAEK